LNSKLSLIAPLFEMPNICVHVHSDPLHLLSRESFVTQSQHANQSPKPSSIWAIAPLNQDVTSPFSPRFRSRLSLKRSVIDEVAAQVLLKRFFKRRILIERLDRMKGDSS
jgi:hypothetical protein